MSKKLLVICGPTASGKTEYAIEVSKHLGGEIISCDSMQLYKYMDIGSAKPTAAEQSEVRHHLVDMIDPREDFSVARYAGLAKAAIQEVFDKDMIPVIEGGTGLYLNSLLYDMDFSNADKDSGLRQMLEKEALESGPDFIYERLKSLDPVKASKIHPNNVKKVIRAIEGAMSGNSITDFNCLNTRTSDYDTVLIGLTREREELYDRINRRVDIMIQNGLVDEVKSLLCMGLTASDISMKGIGYKEIIDSLNGLCTMDEAIDKIKQNSRHLAKRQLTWFRRYDDMNWFNLSELAKDEVISSIVNLYKTK